MRRVLFLVTILGSFSLMELRAQESAFPRFALNGQIRHRLEVNNNDLNSDTEASAFNLLRTRLGVRLFPIEGIEAFVQVQDARAFGEETNTLNDGDADQIDFHQAYLQIANLFDWPLDLQIGRFEAIYGSQRLIGAVGWHNIGRSFDGVRVRLHPENTRLDLFNLKIIERGAPGGSGDLNVYGAYGDFQLIDGFTSHAFLIWQRAQPASTTLNRYTTGLYLSGNTGPFVPELELALQGGEIEGRDVSAYMAAINLSYLLSESPIQPKISAGFDLLSGDDSPAEGDVKVFDTLYATNHKFYGAMDYFLNIPLNTLGLGLQDLHAGIGLKPVDEVTLQLVYHNFIAQQDFILEDGSSASRFGSELDFSLAFVYNSAASFTGGVSWFNPGQIFETTIGPDAGIWAYIMTTVNL